MACNEHLNHSHVHHNDCGHTKVFHEDHIDYLHDGHLHNNHNGHTDEHVLSVNNQNKDECNPVECPCKHDDCGHEKIPHGDHFDYIINGRLHHPHGEHCDDHGPVQIVM